MATDSVRYLVAAATAAAVVVVVVVDGVGGRGGDSCRGGCSSPSTEGKREEKEEGYDDTFDTMCYVSYFPCAKLGLSADRRAGCSSARSPVCLSVLPSVRPTSR